MACGLRSRRAKGDPSMRRYATFLALALIFAPVAADRAAAVTSESTVTTTTTEGPTGRLTITDEKTRSFRLGSESKIYVAPPEVDIAALSGQDVRIYVGPSGQVTRVTRETTVER